MRFLNVWIVVAAFVSASAGCAAPHCMMKHPSSRGAAAGGSGEASASCPNGRCPMPAAAPSREAEH